MTRTKATTSRATKAPPNIVQAMASPALFKPWFEGESWNGWRAVLKAAYALPMTKAEVDFFRTVAERDPPKQRVRELWIAAGRRAGKDSIASMIAAHSAALFDQQDRLRPGERAMVACIAYDKDQARIVLDYTKSYFAEVDLLKGMVQNDERAADLELRNNVDIAVLTNNFRAVRGRPILCAIFDEIAFWRDDTSATPDEETYKAILPGLASLPSAMIVAISSPYRKAGLLHSKFKKHFGKNTDDVLVIRAPTRALNPTIPQKIIDDALAEDPIGARAEWLAEFRDDIGGYLSLEVIESAVDRGVIVRPPREGVTYYAGIDPSGGARDSYTAAVSSRDEKGLVMLDALIEIKPPFNPTTATEQIAALLKTYNITTATSDRYAAEWPASAFRACGITLRHSDRDRSAIYADCLPIFTSGRARLLDNPRLVNQFAGLERKTSSLGRDKIDHGPGGHDDLCNAAALAMVLAATERKPMTFAIPITVEELWKPSFSRSYWSAPSADIFSNAGGPPGGWPNPENDLRRRKTI
jgi:hypothetical protein